MKRSFSVKTYVVMERLNVPTPEGDNARVVDVYLTAEKAMAHVDRVPGTFVSKHRASK